MLLRLARASDHLSPGQLAWGIKRVDALSRETLPFEHADAYVPRVERDVRSPQEVKYSVFATEQKRPSPDWPLMIGEAIQTLRAALNHAVYTAAKGKGKTQFPIFRGPCEFQVIGRPMIRRVPKPIRTLIEDAQPYNRIPEDPTFDELAILNYLSNLDKHRTLATVACAVDLPWVGANSHVDLRWEKVPQRGEVLGHDAEILAFTATSDTEVKKVDVDPSFSYEVRVEGRPLITTLIAICKRVYEVITEIETGEPMNPFAAYPIQQPLPGRHLDGSFL